MEETKPFKIAKQAVKIAFERVKANKGTYGQMNKVYQILNQI